MIIENLRKHDPEKVKAVFIELIEEYMTPAFSSMSKRDFDILLFMKLQKLNVIGENPEMYELIRELRVTRTKARNLLYEAKLRSTKENDLDGELKRMLLKPMFLVNNDLIGLEIDNPFLIDHLKYKLKKLGFVTDGSFSPELVKLSLEAFVELIDTYVIDSEIKKDIEKELIKSKIIEDNSFKAVARNVIQKIGSQVANKAGAKIAGEIFDGIISPLASGSVKIASEKIEDLLG